jgi:hypothetical protein
MKRLVSIFFLCLIVLNTVGYYGLLLIVRRQLTTKILQRIETNAGELGGDLILTIPIQMPYSEDAKEYTSAEGEIIYRGEIYRFVKQRFYHDMLYLVCKRDNQSTRLRDQIADYSRLFSGQDADHADSTIKIINSISKDYTPVVYIIRNQSEGWSSAFNIKRVSDLYLFTKTSSVFHPPQIS